MLSFALNSGINFVILSSCGNTPFAKERFNTWVRGDKIECVACLTILGDRSSHPADESFNCLIMLAISKDETGSMNIVSVTLFVIYDEGDSDTTGIFSAKFLPTLLK